MVFLKNKVFTIDMLPKSMSLVGSSSRQELLFPHHLGSNVLPLWNQDVALPLNPQVLDTQVFVWSFSYKKDKSSLRNISWMFEST